MNLNKFENLFPAFFYFDLGSYSMNQKVPFDEWWLYMCMCVTSFVFKSSVQICLETKNIQIRYK